MEKLVKSDEELNQLREIYYINSLRKSYKVFNGYTMPEKFTIMQQDIEEFEVFDDDVWVISFPKSGSTWTQEMIWCLCNNINLELSKQKQVLARFPILELSVVIDLKVAPDISILHDSISVAKSMKRPRFIKSHLPWELLPKQIRTCERRPKIIVPLRNPKDICVSYFHHTKIFDKFQGDFELFWQLFITDKLPWCPFLAHILSYWSRRDKLNILFVKYEDMAKDLKSVVNTVAKFLEVSILEKEIAPLLKHLSFEEMKANPGTNMDEIMKAVTKGRYNCNSDGNFFRNGKVGSHKVDISKEVITVFDRWIKESFQNTDLEF